MTKILVTGVNGLIAKPLIDALIQNDNYDIFALSTHKEQALTRYAYIKQANFHVVSFHDNIQDINIVINLAGEPIAKSFLTQKRLKTIKSRRLTFLHRLKNYLKDSKPSYFIQASASDIYKDSKNLIYEQDNIDDSDLAKICISQEFSAKELFEDLNTTVVSIRLGIVLAKEALIVRALQNFAPLLIVGNKTYLPYIALEDVVGGIMHLIKTQDVGVFNFTSPCYLSLKELFLCINAKRKCQLKLPAPSFIFKLIDKRAALLLTDKKVVPQKLLNSGYSFKINSKEALSNYLH